MANSGKHYHAVQFYKDELSLAGTVANFLAEGLKNGQPGLVIATPAHAECITREIAQCGLDVETLRTTGSSSSSTRAKRLRPS